VHQPPRSRAALAVGVLGALACGAGIATQSRINGELAAELGDGYTAAFYSFGSGLILVLVALLFRPAGRRGLGIIRDELRSGRMPWWYVVGGTAGAFFVLSQGLTASALGIAVFTVAVVTGQTASGLVIDRVGLATTKPRPITATRIIGAALMLVSVVLVVSTQKLDSFPIWLVLMPLLAGIGMAWQQGVNGQVRVVAKSPLTATAINFIVGTTVLAIAALVHVLIAGVPEEWPTNPVLYTGGAIGAVFIAVGAILAPRIGVLLLALGTISGQLLVSLLLDAVVPAAGHPLVWSTVAGTALTLVALVIATLPSRSGPTDGGATGSTGASRA
jgi:bacterial/archaeal transporter family-2 protein